MPEPLRILALNGSTLPGHFALMWCCQPYFFCFVFKIPIIWDLLICWISIGYFLHLFHLNNGYKGIQGQDFFILGYCRSLRMRRLLWISFRYVYSVRSCERVTADRVLVHQDDLVQVWAITIWVRISTESSKVGYNERVLLQYII